MGMSRTQKEAEVKEIKDLLDDSSLVVLTHYKGLNVSKITSLRGAAINAQSKFKVTKNTLTKLAIEGTDFAPLKEQLSGPTGIVCSQDPVAAARVAWDFSKENAELVILGGVLGSQTLDKKGVESLAKLPSMDELRSKLLGTLQAPASKLAGTLAAAPRELTCVLKAHVDKQQS